MPEFDDLDAAFEALARRAVTNGGRPGAAAAIRTARTRRRRSVAGVAVVAAMAAGAVSAPQLLPDSRPGPSTEVPPEPARFDAAAMDQAAAGWIEGWDDEDPTRRSWTYSGCSVVAVGLLAEPTARTMGTTDLYTSNALASVRVYAFEDQEDLRRSWDDHRRHLDACTDMDPDEPGSGLPDGMVVEHYRLLDDSTTDRAPEVTDVWLARTGNRFALLETVTTAGAAPAGVAEDIGRALLAGTSSGWTERTTPVAPDPVPAPPLPPYDADPLRAALGTWLDDRTPAALGAPAHPCLERVEWADEATVTDSTPRGTFLRISGFDRDAERAAQLTRDRVAGLESCNRDSLTRRDLPGGVISFAYDLGGRGGHGSIWLAHTTDRAMVVTVHGGRSPVPAESSEAVAAWMRSVLDIPWPEAS